MLLPYRQLRKVEVTSVLLINSEEANFIFFQSILVCKLCYSHRSHLYTDHYFKLFPVSFHPWFKFS